MKQREYLKKNVLIVSRMTPRLNSRTRRIIRTLAKKYSVTSICASPDGITNTCMRFEDSELCELSMPMHGKSIMHLAGILRVVKLNYYGVKKAFSLRPEAVVCSDSIYICAGIVAKRIFKKYFIYNAHEIMWALGNGLLLNKFLGWLEKIAIKECDFWLVPSEKRASIILEKHNIFKKYVVNQNFPIVDLNKEDRKVFKEKMYAEGVPQNKVILMFQGTLAPKRGIEELIEAAREGGFHLVIQGGGALYSKLFAIKNKNVTFLKSCPNDEIVQWLSAADVAFIYYENDCLNSAYACSNKLYASVFAGVPIICNRLPVFEDFSSEYGGVIFFESLSKDSIIKSFKIIQNNPEIISQLKEEMAHACKKMTKIMPEQLIEEAFDEIINNKQIINVGQ